MTQGLTGPIATDCGVLALVPDRWAGPWATRHQILSRLSQRFPVSWIEPSVEWRLILRAAHRPPALYPPMPVPRGMSVHPVRWWLPKVYRPPWLSRAVLAARLRAAAGALRRRGCRRLILYLWRPIFAEARSLIQHHLCVYHIDDEYSFADHEAPTDPDELALIGTADLVFVHSPGLLEAKGGINPHTVFAPNGVDYNLYARAWAEPDDLRRVPHPRIGYTGVLKRSIDWDLIGAIADARPEWNLVFVGGINRNHSEVSVRIAELCQRSNFYFLGPKRVDELARYPQHFDVGLMPYTAHSHSARFGYPLKLHEYLASGIPVVGAAAVRTLLEFRGVVNLANDAPEWISAITDALSPEQRSPEARGRRQVVAREYDWDGIVQRIGDAMLARLDSGVPSDALVR